MSSQPSPRVAIVGAGMSGATCASQLRQADVEVTVFDKSRDIGGRLAARRRGDLTWHHGPSELSVASPEFAALVSELKLAGSCINVRRPAPTVEPEVSVANIEHVSGWPDMRELLRPLLREVECVFDTRVTALTREGSLGRWLLETEGAPSPREYDHVILALPAPQAQGILVASGVRVPEAVLQASYHPCWALLLGFDTAVELHLDPAARGASQIASLYRTEVTGGGATGGHDDADRAAHAWVAHATPAWSQRQLELSPEHAAKEMLALLREGGALARGVEPVSCVSHRWRYAVVRASVGAECISVAGADVTLCGDWCLGSTAEAAFFSGVAAAGAATRSLGVDRHAAK